MLTINHKCYIPLKTITILKPFLTILLSVIVYLSADGSYELSRSIRKR